MTGNCKLKFVRDIQPDLIRAQKNDKMTINLSKWIRMGEKEKGDLENDSYKILRQLYKERRDLLFLMVWRPAGEKTKRRYYISITSSYYHSYIKRKCGSDRRTR